jgi:glyoxylase-like metal-dependent hydrolase (beta-lactamase superfamily II)
MARIIPIRLGITTAFLVQDDGAILIDTGCPRDEDRIVAALRRAQVEPRELKLLLHTHGHYDHCGSTRRLKDITGAPVAIHSLDVPLITAGKCDAFTPVRFGARLVRLISYRTFECIQPDIVIDQEMDLDAYGVRGRILFTPGHTAGSISVLLEGGQAIAGDLMVGGFLGGFLFPKRPGYHYFADDFAMLRPSIKKLLDHGAHTVFVAHGGPLRRQAISDYFQI